jgi:hypothetical protein
MACSNIKILSIICPLIMANLWDDFSKIIHKISSKRPPKNNNDEN